MFLLGVAAGLVAARSGLVPTRSGLVGAAINATVVAARGYEYDAEKDCVIVRQVTILSDKISLTENYISYSKSHTNMFMIKQRAEGKEQLLPATRKL